MKNPTEELDVSFSKYVKERSFRLEKHLKNGIPDYAFASDYATRQKIMAIPGAFKLGKAVTSQVVPRQRQLFNMQGIRVGPNQFPDIHEMVRNCAAILGIGVPTVFIMPDVGTINAFAHCTEDADPLIVLNSALVERVSPMELKAVIGHECGHVHNNHGIYNLLVELVVNGITIGIPGLNQIMSLVSLPLRVALMTWSRAAEITCDRAGAICCGEANSMMMVQTRLASGGLLSGHSVNIDAFLEQYDTLQGSPVRIQEFLNTHPLGVRRILAAKEFIKSSVFYDWHPELKEPDMNLYTKEELDARCNRYVSVSKNEERGVR
jgi:Zn-dependent protease with chaperone function